MLITAGPTREYLDPVRFISNESTGTMGLACAQEAQRRGHPVVWVSGTMTARQMLALLQEEWPYADALIMAAAVTDYRPARRFSQKITKEKRETLTLKLVRNPDILEILSKKKNGRCIVGFSLQTKGGVKEGLKKLKQKGLDLIVCNWLTTKQTPFGDQKVTVALLDEVGHQQWLRNATKGKIAKALVDKIEQICYQERKGEPDADKKSQCLYVN